jgi:hypothetical protein
MAFRYFADKEPLATAVSHRKAPANGFNPRRDQPLIQGCECRLPRTHSPAGLPDTSLRGPSQSSASFSGVNRAASPPKVTL